IATGRDFCDVPPPPGRKNGPPWEDTMRRSFSASVLAGLAAVLTRRAPANASEKLRVAKVVPFAWSFTPLDVGIAAGIFAKHGLDVEASASAGDAKHQQLLTSGSIDIGIGSGPGMAFSVKGVPAHAVAAMYGT